MWREGSGKTMKHPTQATLALHAGGDLKRFARWMTDRHLAHCDECRAEAESYREIREILPVLAEVPELPWNRMAAEMRANIRLGLAAGECVRTEQAPEPAKGGQLSWARASVAFASIVALVAGGLVLQRPTPTEDGVVVQATYGGIQIREGGQALRLMHAGARTVTYTVSAQGSMRARYVDPETGYVTINSVNAE
jgi:anti-sigma factor RsiW